MRNRATFECPKCAILVLALLIPALAAAQETERTFESLDRNGNGKIERGEMKQTIREEFKKLDVNGDGVLTEADLEQELPDLRDLPDVGITPKLPKEDTDRDGRITAEEFAAAVTQELLVLLDADGDGTISRSELRGLEGAAGKKEKKPRPAKVGKGKARSAQAKVQRRGASDGGLCHVKLYYYKKIYYYVPYLYPVLWWEGDLPCEGSGGSVYQYPMTGTCPGGRGILHWGSYPGSCSVVKEPGPPPATPKWGQQVYLKSHCQDKPDCGLWDGGYLVSSSGSGAGGVANQFAAYAIPGSTNYHVDPEKYAWIIEGTPQLTNGGQFRLKASCTGKKKWWDTHPGKWIDGVVVPHLSGGGCQINGGRCYFPKKDALAMCEAHPECVALSCGTGEWCGAFPDPALSKTKYIAPDAFDDSLYPVDSSVTYVLRLDKTPYHCGNNNGAYLSAAASNHITPDSWKKAPSFQDDPDLWWTIEWDGDLRSGAVIHLKDRYGRYVYSRFQDQFNLLQTGYVKDKTRAWTIEYSEKVASGEGFAVEGIVYTLPELEAGLATRGFTYVTEGDTIRDGECTLVMPEADAGVSPEVASARANAGMLMCATEIAGVGMRMEALSAYAGCSVILSSGVGSECEVGLYRNTMTLDWPADPNDPLAPSSLQLDVKGPNAGYCASASTDGFCLNAAAEVASASVSVEDEYGNGCGVGASVGFGLEAGASASGGVLRVGVDVKVLLGAEVEIAFGYEKTGKAVYRVGENALAIMHDGGKQVVVVGENLHSALARVDSTILGSTGKEVVATVLTPAGEWVVNAGSDVGQGVADISEDAADKAVDGAVWFGEGVIEVGSGGISFLGAATDSVFDLFDF